jgi:hypothetical protein
MLEKPLQIFHSKSLRDMIEMHVYGVCSYLGKKIIDAVKTGSPFFYLYFFYCVRFTGNHLFDSDICIESSLYD